MKIEYQKVRPKLSSVFSKSTVEDRAQISGQ